MLFIGALIVVIAGITYASIYWSQWNSFGRILAILLPMGITYVVGQILYTGQKHKNEGAVFLMVSAVLFPLFLLVVFQEYLIFESQPDIEGLIFFGICFLYYLCFSLQFKYPGWTFLYQTMALFVYFFGLRLIFSDQNLMQTTMAWLWFILGLGYLYGSLLYDKTSENFESKGMYLLAALVLFGSQMILLGESYKELYLAFFLLVIGLLFFIAGLNFERISLKIFSSLHYFLGASVTTIVLIRLASDGTLLGAGQLIQDGKYEMIGLSHLVVSVSYLLIGWFLMGLKKYGLVEASKYGQFFSTIAPLWIMFSIMFLGLGGHQPIYETLLLITSLVFIFGSIQIKSRNYLYIGTMFLIFYIFSMGGEYFQNQAGWPITLFIAGLVSMGIGVAMEKVRKTLITNQVEIK